MALAVALLAFAPVAASAATWTQKSTSGPKESGSSISCASETCIAVGSGRGVAGAFMPLAEKGSEEGGKFSWGSAPIAVPNPPETTSAELFGVSCTAANSCSAVGSYKHPGEEALSEFWNGTAWTIQAAPKLEGSLLDGISCTATNFCIAVGQFGTSTLAVRWNGTEWLVQLTPNPVGAEGSRLISVSCSSTESCTAVGESHAGGVRSTLAEGWNGKAWTIQTTPNPEGSSSGSRLNAVSCTSSSFCRAVGETAETGGPQTLIENWNGTEWTLEKGAKSVASLSGVSCTSATACVAVGTSSAKNLAEDWNGTEWLSQTTPNPSGSASGGLKSVACLTASTCTATGAYRVTTGGETERMSILHLAEATWTEKGTPGPKENLATIACINTETCTAGGAFHGTTGSFLPLAERGPEGVWTGTPSVVPTPSEIIEGKLLGMSCPSKTACIGVGYYKKGTYDEPLVESWNGSSWTLVETPKATGTVLEGVSCTAVSACTAVGNTLGIITIAERWNGTKWTIQSTPNPGGLEADNRLTSVSCASAESCTAVGESRPPGSKKALVEKWNGKEWTVQSTPSITGSSLLRGVSCTSLTFCRAVGESVLGGTETLIENWNGTEWTIEKGSKAAAALTAVSCVSSVACMAVGWKTESAHAPLSQIWNGTEWATQAPLVPTGATLSEFTGVSCAAAASCWAVGSYRVGAAFEPERTLIEHYG